MGHKGFPGQDLGTLGWDGGRLQSWGHVSTTHSFIHSLTGSFSLWRPHLALEMAVVQACP